MKRFIAVVGIAVLASACTDSTDSFAVDPQRTISVPGNNVGTPGCEVIDLAGCYAILDHHFKVLYEINSTAARRGEAEYQVVSNANKKLAWIFVAESRTVEQALRSLDQFANSIARAVDRGGYSNCWGDHVLAYAAWLRGKLVSGDLDMTGAPAMTCQVSPVAVTGQGSTDSGVILTITDPWHFSGDPYGTYVTRTWFVVNGPNGTITTAPAIQTGADVITITDATVRTAGTYPYSVAQCSDWGACSAFVSVDVVVTGPPATP